MWMVLYKCDNELSTIEMNLVYPKKSSVASSFVEDVLAGDLLTREV